MAPKKSEASAKAGPGVLLGGEHRSHSKAGPAGQYPARRPVAIGDLLPGILGTIAAAIEARAHDGRR